RLERSDRQRRQFVSDASHELRTPLAVLRSEAEVARRAPDTTTVADFGRVVIGETNRLESLVEDLLSLARADERKLAGARTAAPVELDVDDVVLNEAERTRRLPIDRSQVSAGRVIGRADDLARAVGHLLDNAARHGEMQVAVGVRTETGTNGAGSQVRIWVDDDGAGIPD
ncbi:MAG: HAMP domain-containing sensor histidine kinase, partial [Actinomycetota bacterium]